MAITSESFDKGYTLQMRYRVRSDQSMLIEAQKTERDLRGSVEYGEFVAGRMAADVDFFREDDLPIVERDLSGSSYR